MAMPAGRSVPAPTGSDEARPDHSGERDGRPIKLQLPNLAGGPAGPATRETLHCCRRPNMYRRSRATTGREDCVIPPPVGTPATETAVPPAPDERMPRRVCGVGLDTCCMVEVDPERR